MSQQPVFLRKECLVEIPNLVDRIRSLEEKLREIHTVNLQLSQQNGELIALLIALVEVDRIEDEEVRSHFQKIANALNVADTQQPP